MKKANTGGARQWCGDKTGLGSTKLTFPPGAEGAEAVSALAGSVARKNGTLENNSFC